MITLVEKFYLQAKIASWHEEIKCAKFVTIYILLKALINVTSVHKAQTRKSSFSQNVLYLQKRYEYIISTNQEGIYLQKFDPNITDEANDNAEEKQHQSFTMSGHMTDLYRKRGKNIFYLKPNLQLYKHLKTILPEDKT